MSYKRVMTAGPSELVDDRVDEISSCFLHFFNITQYHIYETALTFTTFTCKKSAAIYFINQADWFATVIKGWSDLPSLGFKTFNFSGFAPKSTYFGYQNHDIAPFTAMSMVVKSSRFLLNLLRGP